MSGGSLDYVYNKVIDAAYSIEERATCPEHRAFAVHLRKVAQALHDVEWVFSADYAAGEDLRAIREVVRPSDVLKAATKQARESAAELNRLLAKAKEL